MAAVSIILPTYNRTPLVRIAVDSVLAQSFGDWELIVADDGSARDTQNYLDALEANDRVRLLRLPHSGNPGMVRNAAIAQACGKLIAFLDSDDFWSPEKLERQISLLQRQNRCEWGYTAFRIVDADGELLDSELNRQWLPYQGDIFEEITHTSASIRVSAVVASTSLLRKVGGFDEKMRCSEDYDLWMRLALRSAVGLLDEPVTHIRRHAENQNRPVGTALIARDYSLNKLSHSLHGRQRATVRRERSRNATILASALATSGNARKAIQTLGTSLPFSWQYAEWWLGSTKALARIALGRRER